MVEYKALNNELSLYVEERLLINLYEVSMKFYPNEYGGILLGHYSENRDFLSITGTILPFSFKSSKEGFTRGAAGLQNELATIASIKPLTKYVGEWHTHPDTPAIPSPTDKVAMKNIANDPDCSILNPVLLIISTTKTCFKIKFYVQYENQLYPFE